MLYEKTRRDGTEVSVSAGFFVGNEREVHVVKIKKSVILRSVSALKHSVARLRMTSRLNIITEMGL